MNVLTIDEIAVRQDTGGRYCLNDLHRVSGGDIKHQPSFWMRNAQTRALIEEIGNSAILQSSETAGIPVVTREGVGGGTHTRGRQISRITRVTGKGLEFLRCFAQR